MVIHRNEMRTEDREKMRDGEGVVHFTYLLDGEKEKNARMFAEISLPPGSSIGYHQHKNEAEYFFIVSGSGTVRDNGKDVEVKAGDAIITRDGDFHGVKNTGKAPLVFHAVIITY